MYLNQVTIIGNLTRDPELKALPSGSNVVNFSVATNRTWYNDKKEKQEAVEYHNIVAFGKQAETIAQYMKKGSQILVEGRLQTRNWEQDGVKRYATDIIVESFQFGAKSNPTQTETAGRDNSDNLNKEPEEKPTQDDNYPTEDINPDDIPFNDNL